MLPTLQPGTIRTSHPESDKEERVDHLGHHHGKQKLCFWHILLVSAATSVILLVSLLVSRPVAASFVQGDTPTPSPTVTPRSNTATATNTSPPTTPSTEPPTQTPTPAATQGAPTATPQVTPSVPGTPEAIPPHRSDFLLIVGIAVLLLGVAGTGFMMYRIHTGRRPLRPPTPEPISPVPPGPSGPEEPEIAAQPPSPITIEPPQPGTPYLASQGRPAGALYCSLTQPETTIGRAPANDLVIDEHFMDWQTVSREHARIERAGEDFIVVDMDSRNGVYVNGQRTGENLLREGDVVSFGRVQFVFRLNREGRVA